MHVVYQYKAMAEQNVKQHVFYLQVISGDPGVQWLSGRVLDWRMRGRGLKPHRGHCLVSLSKSINPCLVLVQPRKTHPFITERLLMGPKESNQTKQMSGDPEVGVLG